MLYFGKLRSFALPRNTHDMYTYVIIIDTKPHCTTLYTDIYNNLCMYVYKHYACIYSQINRTRPSENEKNLKFDLNRRLDCLMPATRVHTHIRMHVYILMCHVFTSLGQ